MAKAQTILAKGPGHLPNRRSHWMENFNCGRTRNDFGVPPKACGKGYGSSAMSAPSLTTNASNRAVTRPAPQIDPSGVEAATGTSLRLRSPYPASPRISRPDLAYRRQRWKLLEHSFLFGHFTAFEINSCQKTYGRKVF
jgi:hypothetical protein